MGLRVGIGYDIHAVAKARRLMLGGVSFETDWGLDGHSDAGGEQLSLPRPMMKLLLAG